MTKGKKKLYIIIGILVVLGVLLVSLVNFITDLLWFKDLGYISVFLKQLITELEFGIPCFVVISAICFVYLLAIKKAYYKKIGGYEKTHSEKRVNLAALGLSLAFGLINAVRIAHELWFKILEFTNSTDFSILDPIFNQDVSFYIFKLGLLQDLNGMLLSIIIGFAIVNVLFYFCLLALRRPQFFERVSDEEYEEYRRREQEYQQQRQQQEAQNGPNPGGAFGEMFGEMFGQSRGQKKPQPPKRPRNSSIFSKDSMLKLLNIAQLQFKVLGVLFFLLVGSYFYLSQFSLLYTSSSSVVYGAGFTDINIQLWVYRLLIVLSVAAAVMFVLGLSRRKIRQVFVVPVIMLGVTVLGSVASMLTQSLIVEPDEINKEYAYLENNINFTRYAYGLEDIQIEDYDVRYDLTKDDILANTETIANIRINDYQPALKYYNQTQSIRLYYNFNDVDVDRYMVNGEYTQTFLSAREIDESTISDTWLTKHIKYTHGYGITLSRVDKVTESGQPDMLIDSIPPVSSVEEIQVTRPEIYFGEDTNSYIIVNTDEQEFDYPSGESNIYTTYEGDTGINLNLLNRILFAIREGDIQILVSTNISSDSKIIFNRNVVERVQKIAPFLEYDEDPYIVVADGELYWIMDGYTVSSYYPYSEPFNNSGINYIRNSVKVTVNAYSGETSFYVVDDEDPIAVTLQKIYPDLFKDFDDMSEALQQHIRYPNTMFTIQASVFAKYHMTDVNVFYQNEDGWDLATEVYGNETVTMTPNYYIMKLPGENQSEFINSVPYTPSGKFNLTALLVARNDGDNYGSLILYQMPKDRLIYGPQQVESQINQHTEIAQDFTLWSSAGSTYTRGNLFVIPIEGSLMYVEPIYLESASSSLPEVKRVIIYYNEKIAYEETLAEALDSMFGSGASAALDPSGGTIVDDPDDVVDPDDNPDNYEGPGLPGDELSITELAELANEAFENAVNAQQNGDWAAYGEYLDELADYLAQMAAE